MARSPVAMVSVCRASNPGRWPCSSVGHTDRLTVETTRSPAALTTSARADSAPASASSSERGAVHRGEPDQGGVGDGGRGAVAGDGEGAHPRT